MKGSLLSDITVTPYVPPVDPTKFFTYFSVFGAVGLVFAMWFFVYEASVSKSKRSIFKELPLALLASATLGFAFLFLLLWAGLWV